MNKKYIMALDQGTTSSRASIFDKNGHIVTVLKRNLLKYYPKVRLGRT